MKYKHTHMTRIRKRMSITLNPYEIEKLTDIASDHDTTRSGMISKLIMDYKGIKGRDKHYY